MVIHENNKNIMPNEFRKFGNNRSKCLVMKHKIQDCIVEKFDMGTYLYNMKKTSLATLEDLLQLSWP